VSTDHGRRGSRRLPGFESRRELHDATSPPCSDRLRGSRRRPRKPRGSLAREAKIAGAVVRRAAAAPCDGDRRQDSRPRARTRSARAGETSGVASGMRTILVASSVDAKGQTIPEARSLARLLGESGTRKRADGIRVRGNPTEIVVDVERRPPTRPWRARPVGDLFDPRLSGIRASASKMRGAPWPGRGGGGGGPNRQASEETLDRAASSPLPSHARTSVLQRWSAEKSAT
jgi:hypothetical protein